MIILLIIVFFAILILCVFIISSLLSQFDFAKRVSQVENIVTKDVPNALLIKLREMSLFKGIDFLLLQAGFRSKTALVKYISACVIFSVFFIVLAVYFTRYEHFPFLIKVMLPVIGFILGIELPYIYVQVSIRSRRNKIQQILPDVIAVLNMYVDAGYSLNKALHSTARDLQYYAPEIAQEFSITANDLEVTNNYHEVWQALVKRVNLTELQILVTALEQSYKYGMSLKNILHNLISQSNKERMVRLEERGARLPVYMSIILIFCFMPIMFAIILTPLIIKAIDAFKTIH